MREDFPEDIKRILAQRAGSLCSRPDCRAATSGPQVESAKALNVGVAAHITAASPGGPRYDPSLTSEARRAVDNAIWLCQNCAKLVDNDPKQFTTGLLRDWKADAEARARAAIGRTQPSAAGAPSLRIELPGAMNPIGHIGGGGGFTRSWNVKVRLITVGGPLDIIELGMHEPGVGEWIMDEIILDNGKPLQLPITVERAAAFWIRGHSPRTEDRRYAVQEISVWLRDHTQSDGEAHRHVLQQPLQD